MSCNNIYFSKLILKREDTYFCSFKYRGIPELSDTRRGHPCEKFCSNCPAPWSRDFTEKRIIPSTNHFASHGLSVIRSKRLGVEPQLGCTTMSCQIGAVRCALCRTRHRDCPVPSVLFHQIQLSSLQQTYCDDKLLFTTLLTPTCPNNSINSWRMKDHLDVICYFISLLMCSKCFEH